VEQIGVEVQHAAIRVKDEGKLGRGKGWRYAVSRAKKERFYYLLAALPIVWFLVFRYLPMYGVIIAFKDYDLYQGIEGILSFDNWVGLVHFRKFLSSVFFWNIMRNTVVISLLRTLWGFPAPIILALLLNEVRIKWFKRSVQTISYLPHFFSMVVVAGLVQMVLTVQGGLLNQVIQALGHEPHAFLSDPKWFRTILVVTGMWQGMGWGSILYLAAISGINPEMYEAAIVDGAGIFQRMRYITLPSMSYAIAINLIFRIGGLLNAGFGQILLLYSEPVYDVADIIDTYVYRVGLVSRNYSFATAVGLFKSVVALILLLVANWGAKRLGEEGIW